MPVGVRYTFDLESCYTQKRVCNITVVLVVVY